LINKLFIKYLR